ncbi:VanW family protein [Peptoniphilus raoultii]|uniref:VanW family protein n=1 Tax=Peptoniphilus raoultii TaxID=1776387 RepID=UPI0008D8E642|nr:VanW family protein [Peptoniphilus raoultii]
MEKTKSLSNKSKSKVKTNKKLHIGLIILVFVGILLIISYASQKRKDVIYSGVKVSGIKLTNLSKAEAYDLIKSKGDEIIATRDLKFIDGENVYVYPISDFGYSLNYEKAIEEAYNQGRSDSKLNNFFRVSVGNLKPVNIKLEESYDHDKTEKLVEDLQEKIYVKAQDAALFVSPEKTIEIVKEVPGRYLEKSETLNLIKDNLLEGGEIKLPIYKIEPKVMSTDFGGIDKLIGEFSTNYEKSEQNRKDNIAKGASFFNGKLVRSGEEVSFNKTIGEITEETGFKTAGVIVNGEFDRGVGGGICQVSTTLYNALLRSDLEIIERSNHTRPISYVPLGTDAAVASGYKDLIFKNNTKHPIYLLAKANGTDLDFMIFGNGVDRDYQVNIVPKLKDVIEPKTKEKYTEDMEVGESIVEKKGSKGYSYVTFKEILKNDEVIRTEEISKSYYSPQDRVVLVGDRDPDDNKDREED